MIVDYSTSCFAKSAGLNLRLKAYDLRLIYAIIKSMRTIGAILASVVAVFCFSITITTKEVAADPPTITDLVFISRINSENGKEFIEIYNSAADDIEILNMNVKVFNSTVSGTAQPTQTFEFAEGYIEAGSFILIKQDGLENDIPGTSLTKNADKAYGITNNIITTSGSTTGGRIDLTIDNETASVCWGTWANSILSTIYCNYTVTVADRTVAVTPLCIDDCLDNTVGFGGYHKKFYPQYCEYLQLSEISVGEQWIEIYNKSNVFITSSNLETCVIEIPNPDNNNPYQRYFLSQVGDIGPSEYSVIEMSITRTFTKANEKKNGRLIVIRDSAGTYSSVYYHPQKADTSLALIDNEWKITYHVTRGEENIYQQWQTCEAGKIINEKTGNCIKEPEPPADCAEGYFRNPESGRCKKIAVKEPLSECAVGYFRNPLTNRCKKIAVNEGPKPCQEGWERNPETNRCRKIISSDKALFGVEQMDSETENMWGWAGGAGLMAIAGITGWQFKPEMSRAFRKLRRKQ